MLLTPAVATQHSNKPDPKQPIGTRAVIEALCTQERRGRAGTNICQLSFHTYTHRNALAKGVGAKNIPCLCFNKQWRYAES